MSYDDAFYEQVLAPLEGRMLRTVRRLLRDPQAAEDVLQDALVRVWRSRDVVRRHPRPQALVLRICLHAALDACRRSGRRREADAPFAVDERADGVARSPEAQAVDRARRLAVLAAIAQLPRQQALALTLRVLDEQPYRDVARVMGCSAITARIHAMRGRARLRSLLEAWRPSGGSTGGLG